MSLESISKEELIDIILVNNMVEEFVAWLRNKKNISLDPVSLRDLDYSILLEFAVEKKLISSDEYVQTDYYRDSTSIDEVDLKRLTKPKKIRRKT